MYQIEITKDEFEEYKEIQMSGDYNMLDPRARAQTSLDKTQWMHIIKNYNELNKSFKWVIYKNQSFLALCYLLLMR